MSRLLEAEQVNRLQKQKRRNLILLTTSMILTVLACALRFVPSWNDRLSGQPQYARAMTRLTASEIARASEYRFPVIVLGQDDRCDALGPTGITEGQIAGTLYGLTWSESERFTCITTYAVPVGVSKFAGLRTIYPGEGWTLGPQLMGPVQALPIMRSLHVFPRRYLQMLHWRATPWRPMTEKEAAPLAARRYDSVSDPLVSPDASAGLTLDFDRARALVREPHDRINFRLSLLLAALSMVSVASAFALFLLYRKFRRCQWLSQPVQTVGAFLLQDLFLEETAARARFLEQQREFARQKQQVESLRWQRQELEFRLRSALEGLHDPDLRQSIEEFLAAGSEDIDKLGELWEEVIKDSVDKTPEERLAALLESLKPYCTREELESCREEALSILEGSGFRAARKYVIAAHDDFRLRAREMEASESQDSPLVDD